MGVLISNALKGQYKIDCRVCCPFRAMDIGKIVPAALRRAGVCCPLRDDPKHKIRNSQENYLPQLLFFQKKYFADILRIN
ncbi:MAG: hypothetical protein LBQ66_07770 [Planctomycetaceae bacterium]|nr:hypothetical protein [Planctomycetaceae bacterium]